MRVTSLPVSRPKSSSPSSGGMRLKPCAAQEHRHRAERQVQVLGVWNQGQENQQRQRVQPPVDALAGAILARATSRAR